MAHGDSRGSVDCNHHTFGEPFIEPNPIQESANRERMSGSPIELSDAQRAIVDKTIREVAKHRQWLIHTLNVRTNHVHVVVTTPGVSPEKAMNDFKAWATRRLREAGLVGDEQIWSRHGSTPHLYNDAAVLEAINYVANLQ